jgi:hypothetical protein
VLGMTKSKKLVTSLTAEQQLGERELNAILNAKPGEVVPVAGTGSLPKPILTEGVKHDDGKLRIDLFPSEAIFAISQVLTFGARKYADRNWERGMSWGRVFGALMRHLWCWWAGRGPTGRNFVFGDTDDETKYSHLWHAGCCIVFLITYEERGMTDYDDRPKAG